MIEKASSKRVTRSSVGWPNASYSGVVPAGPEAEDEAAAGDRIGRRGHVREQGRIAERHAHDERADLDAVRGGGEGGEDRPPLVDALGRLPRRATEEVVTDPGGVEAELLGMLGEGEHLRPGWHAAPPSDRDIGTVTPTLIARSLGSASAPGFWENFTTLLRLNVADTQSVSSAVNSVAVHQPIHRWSSPSNSNPPNRPQKAAGRNWNGLERTPVHQS
jgi:hypothetical protein